MKVLPEILADVSGVLRAVKVLIGLDRPKRSCEASAHQRQQLSELQPHGRVRLGLSVRVIGFRVSGFTMRS